MRKLMWFSVGFAAAIFTGAYLLAGNTLLLLAVIFSVLCVVLLLICRNRYRVIAIAILGAAVGFFYFWGFDRAVISDAKLLDGQNAQIQIEAVDYSFETGYGNAVDGVILRNDRKYRIRLFYQCEEDVKPGDSITADVKLRFTPEGGLQKTTYHKGEGIYLLAYAVDEIQVAPTTELPGKYFPAFLRKIITQRIAEIFPERTAGFAKALLLGDDSDLTFADNMTFQKSGIRHIIAVSGLHVSILFSLVYFVTGRKGLLTLFAGIPVLFLFAAVAGFTPSVVRACVMQGFVILSIAVNKEYDPPTALAFAVLVILGVNPLAVTSVSFQLSVGSMIGIFAFSGKIRDYLYNEKRLGHPNGRNWKSKLKRWFVVSVSISVSALIITLPLCAMYFGMVCVVGVVTNLLTLWVTSFIFCGIMASCMLSVIWMPLGVLGGWIVSVPIQYVQFVAKICASIPFGVAYTDSVYTVLWVVMTLVLIGIFYVSRKKSVVLLIASIICLYVVSLFATWVEPRLNSFRLTVLDVGQGQCILLQSKDEAYLIDCGGDHAQHAATAAVNAMGAQGIRRLNGVILSHYDTDHAGGAAYVTSAFDVDTLYLPDIDSESAVRCGLELQNIPIDWVTQNTTISCGAGEITLFPAKNQSENNESSMCILFQTENCAILITGDRTQLGESQLLQQPGIGNIDILVVGHHGASTSTGLELLYATKPKVAIISVGENNVYDHPNRETLDRLKRAGCLIYRTDQEGTIIIGE